MRTNFLNHSKRSQNLKNVSINIAYQKWTCLRKLVGASVLPFIALCIVQDGKTGVPWTQNDNPLINTTARSLSNFITALNSIGQKNSILRKNYAKIIWTKDMIHSLRLPYAGYHSSWAPLTLFVNNFLSTKPLFVGFQIYSEKKKILWHEAYECIYLSQECECPSTT